MIIQRICSSRLYTLNLELISGIWFEYYTFMCTFRVFLRGKNCQRKKVRGVKEQWLQHHLSPYSGWVPLKNVHIFRLQIHTFVRLWFCTDYIHDFSLAGSFITLTATSQVNNSDNIISTSHVLYLKCVVVITADEIIIDEERKNNL